MFCLHKWRSVRIERWFTIPGNWYEPRTIFQCEKCNKTKEVVNKKGCTKYYDGIRIVEHLA